MADATAAPSASATDESDDALLARLQSDAAQVQQQQPQQQLQESGAAENPKDAWWTAKSAITMCSIVLAFGFVVILISSGLALKKIDKDTILKIVVIPMAVMLAIFLVVAGYSDSQIAPAMGLLGTVVGYVLGATKKAEDERPSPSAQVDKG